MAVADTNVCTPAIILAGRAWPVPKLAPRQNRIVVPALLRFGTGAEAHYDLLLDIAFAALTRGHPEIVRNEFENWPIATHELLDALPVVAKQTGLMRMAPNHRPQPELVEGPPDWDLDFATLPARSAPPLGQGRSGVSGSQRWT